MINYKDLMIGNWVYESERSKFPMRVVNIGEDYCYLDFDGNQGDVWEVKDKDMMPIGIDAAILKKIGFRKVRKNFGYNYKTTIPNYTISIEEDNIVRVMGVGFWHCKIYSKMFNIGEFYFETLHELQNGIRLITKSDLEIKEI